MESAFLQPLNLNFSDGYVIHLPKEELANIQPLYYYLSIFGIERKPPERRACVDFYAAAKCQGSSTPSWADRPSLILYRNYPARNSANNIKNSLGINSIYSCEWWPHFCFKLERILLGQELDYPFPAYSFESLLARLRTSYEDFLYNNWRQNNRKYVQSIVDKRQVQILQRSYPKFSG